MKNLGELVCGRWIFEYWVVLPKAHAHAIAHDAMEVGVESHEDIRWCDEQEGDGVVVAKGSGEGWEEVLETCRAGDAHLGLGQLSSPELEWSLREMAHICNG